jgi:hypothetical protein
MIFHPDAGRVDLAEGPAPDAFPWLSRATRDRAARASQARHASSRRRLVDPTTCERDYSAAELEFMNAIQEYKRQSGRPFPTWAEVLSVARGLGYAQAAPAD